MTISWSPPSFNTVPSVLTEPLGTDFPYGCRWCGKSTLRDGVEICEALEGLVHADCHDLNCSDRRCAYLTCTPERCALLTECEDCCQEWCVEHHVDCVCDTV